jgi:hypothetical protein
MTTIESPSSSCPLCGSSARLHHADGPRRYFRCPECTLIHVDPDRRLSADQERRYFERQRSGLEPPGSGPRVRQLTEPLLATVSAGSHGLDYGCGPTATLAQFFTDAGRPCGGYDCWFFPDETPLNRTYDFVVSVEAIDHTKEPASTFALFGRLLVPRGVIGVMTRFYTSEVPFGQWWYRREPIRVCFYSESTMRWIALHNRWKVRFPAPGVALFRV